MDYDASDPLSMFFGALILIALAVGLTRWFLHRRLMRSLRRLHQIAASAAPRPDPRSSVHYANTIAPHRAHRSRR